MDTEQFSSQENNKESYENNEGSNFDFVKNKDIVKKIDRQEKASKNNDKQKSETILDEINHLDGASFDTAEEREAAKKKLAQLGKKYDDLDGGDEIAKAADERVVHHTPSGLDNGVAEQNLRASKLDEDFKKVDHNLALFAVLDEHLPNWEAAVGAGKNAESQDPRGEAVQKFANSILKAVGETGLRADNQHIFMRACEALSLTTGRNGEALRGHLFDETGRPNDEAIKAFATANKELLINPNITITATNIISLEAASAEKS